MLALVVAALLQTQADTTVIVRGTVRDIAGRPLEAVEVSALTLGRSTRTGADGRFALRVLPGLRTRMVARLPGRRPVDTLLMPLASGAVVELAFVLRRLPQALDTMRVIAQAECPVRTFEGFQCRRRSGVGAFRDSTELDYRSAATLANLAWGMEGLGPNGPTEGWRCLQVLYDGERPRQEFVKMLAPEDVIGIEFFAKLADVPEWYRNVAFAAHGGSAGSSIPGERHTYRAPYMPGRQCSLMVFWTKFARRYDPKLDQNKAVKQARIRRQLMDMLSRDTTRTDTVRTARWDSSRV